MTRSRQAWIARGSAGSLGAGPAGGSVPASPGRRSGGDPLPGRPGGDVVPAGERRAGNTAPAALLLAGSAGRAGQRAWGWSCPARGLVVLALRDAGEAEQGWAYLTARPEVWVQRTGVVVLGDGMEPALELAGAASPSPRPWCCWARPCPLPPRHRASGMCWPPRRPPPPRRSWRRFWASRRALKHKNVPGIFPKAPPGGS